MYGGRRFRRVYDRKRDGAVYSLLRHAGFSETGSRQSSDASPLAAPDDDHVPPLPWKRPGKDKHPDYRLLLTASSQVAMVTGK